MGLPTRSLHINFETAISPKPQAGDFVSLPFRLLSQDIVGSGTWKSTDFRSAEVLKNSIPLLEGKPAFTDHYTWGVADAIGVIKNVRWEEAFTDEAGKMIPAGIVGDYVLDAQVCNNAELIRKILGSEEMGIPPAVNGSSVGISFEWTPSHDFGTDEGAQYRFERAVGTMLDGREVTRVVTKIVDFRESSLVNFPADKNARNRIKKYGVKNGNGQFEATFSFNDDTEEARKLYEEKQTYSVFEEYFTTETAGEPTQTETNPTPEPQDFSLQLSEAQATITRLEAEAGEERTRATNLQATIESLQASEKRLQASLAERVAELTQALTERDNFEAKVTDLQPRATIGDAHLIELRRETEKAYQLACTGEPNKHLLAQIANADYDTLKALHTQYLQEYDKAHPLTCQNCGSQNLTTQSSVSPVLEGFDAQQTQANPFDTLFKNVLTSR